MNKDDKLFEQLREAGRSIMDQRLARPAMPETPGPGPEDLLFELIRDAGRLIMDNKLEKLEELGLADLNVNMLQYIDIIGSLERPNATRIAEALGLAKPSVTAILQKLERRGIVQKQPNPKDGRSVQVVLTEKGSRVMEAYRDAHRAFALQLKDRLEPDDYAKLVDLLAAAMGRGGVAPE